MTLQSDITSSYHLPELSAVALGPAVLILLGGPDWAVNCRNVAPEVLDPELQRKDSGGYGPEVDLWAIGVVLYSMLCGFPPFYSENNADLMQQIRKAEYCFHSPYWDEVSFGAKDLVASLLVVNPCRRFTSHQCLAHQWIKHAGDASSQKLHRCDEHGAKGGPHYVANTSAVVDLAALLVN